MTVQWSQIFDDALKRSNIVSVHDALAKHFDREPTPQELSAASRASKRYSATSNVQLVRVPPSAGSRRVVLLLARADADLDDADRLRDIAVGRAVKRAHQGQRTKNVPQRVDSIVGAVGKAARSSRNVAASKVAPDHAVALADELAEAIGELREFERRLRMRGG